MPVVELKRNLPVSDKFSFLALDEDGFDCPADWLVALILFFMHISFYAHY